MFTAEQSGSERGNLKYPCVKEIIGLCVAICPFWGLKEASPAIPPPSRCILHYLKLVPLISSSYHDSRDYRASSTPCCRGCQCWCFTTNVTPLWILLKCDITCWAPISYNFI